MSGKYNLQGKGAWEHPDMLVDEYNLKNIHQQRPTTCIPGKGGPQISPNFTAGPHALFNHQRQAASKKSFRIRGEKEKELMKRQASQVNQRNDFGDFNNGK